MGSPKSVRLCDVVSSLMKRGKEEEANEYYLYCIVYISFIHDIPPEDVIEMTIDEIAALLSLPPKPLKYEGWNHTWGNAAFNNPRDKYVA